MSPEQKRLEAYARIIANARKALNAITTISEADPARYVGLADGYAVAGLISLDMALEEI